MSWLTQSGWALAKDIALTIGGLVLIGSQVFSPRPSYAFLITGLALTGIGASFHIGPAIEGFFGRSGTTSSSPPSTHSSPSLPSGSSPEGRVP